MWSSWYPRGYQILHVGHILHTNFRICHIRISGPWRPAATAGHPDSRGRGGGASSGETGRWLATPHPGTLRRHSDCKLGTGDCQLAA
jgi:hypothetical protein